MCLYTFFCMGCTVWIKAADAMHNINPTPLMNEDRLEKILPNPICG